MPRFPSERIPVRVQRPTPFVLAAAAVVATVAFVALLTYYGSGEFSRRAANTRASNEAMSFAEHSSTLATGDAFDGYIQILRYADDPILSAFSSTPNARTAALQQLLYLNVNKFNSLTIVDRSGLILATTDSTIVNVKPSAAFSATRANLAPANSDIILPEAGRHGYVEYSAPLRDPTGTIWGILVGRADPATLWKGTLLAAVDGSRNVIINNEGLFSAGVPDELLRQPWHGRPLSNGGVRANIAGVDSICGLAPIGKDTQIDRGLNVASCLPVSLIQIEAHSATDKQGWITIAAAVLAIVIASVALKFLIGGGAPAVEQRNERIEDEPAIDGIAARTPTLEGVFADATDSTPGGGAKDDDTSDDTEASTALLAADSDEAAQGDAERPATDQAPPPDIDALTLIEAYEQRNAGLADRLRDAVQAKLLVATIEADEAFKLVETDAEAAATMHEHAMEELETIRKRQLRSIGQELFPGLTRLGLPGAMKAMRKELRDVIDVTLDIDATTDSVAGGASRSSVSPALRLVMYRFALDSVRALAAAGAETCEVSLRRDGELLGLAISCGAGDLTAAGPGADAVAASALAVEAYAGSVTLAREGARFVIALRVPAPPIEAGPDVEIDFEDADGGDVDEPAAVAQIRQIPLDELFGEEGLDDGDDPAPDVMATSGVALEPRAGIAAALEGLQAEFFGSMIVALDVAGDFDAAAGRALEGATGSLMLDVTREALRALQVADARACDIGLAREDDEVVVRVNSQAEQALFDATHIYAYASALAEIGGYLSVIADDAGVDISVRVRLSDAVVVDAAENGETESDASADDAGAPGEGAQHAA